MNQYRELAVRKIRENPDNPRSEIVSVEDLKASIKASGLLQPITVRTLDDGTYQVVAGSRRFRAVKDLGFETVPCNVLDGIDDDTAYKLATTENIVREDMTAVDEAKAVAKLFAQGRSRTEIGAMFGKSARWAEGRRKIVELGDKAMQYLSDGKINLGHAEVLTMCRQEDVEKWLSFATWKSPEDLKLVIMNERPLLERAPFNAKKVCKNCEKRSDRQLDLFGDVQCSHCLDRECFEANVKKEAEWWRKKLAKEGYEEVPEYDCYAAMNEWHGWVSTSTEEDDDAEFVKECVANGTKPMFWVDDRTAEHGLVYRRKDDEEEEEEEDRDSWDWKIGHMDHDRRRKIRDSASSEERRVVADKLKGVFGNIGTTAKAFILEILGSHYDDGEGNVETWLMHQHEAAAVFTEKVAEEIVDWYRGVDKDVREFLEMDSREEYERAADAMLPQDVEEEDADN